MPITRRAALLFAAASWLCATSASAADLSLERVSVKVRTADRLARTRLTVAVQNHTDEWQEAYIDLDLPHNAAVTRLSMDVGTSKNRPRMEGRIGDRERAAEIYQDIVDEARDPALLEDLGHGRYQLRVFPVPGNDTKTVILEYEHLLPRRGSEGSYVFEPPRLRSGPEQIRRFSMSIDGRSKRRGAWSVNDPIRVSVPTDEVQPFDVSYARHGGSTYFRVDVAPDAEVEPRRYGGIVLALDTSRTMHERFDEAVAQVQTLHAALKNTADVRIVHGDREAMLCDSLDCVTSVRPAGGSDLGALLREATKQAETLEGPVAIVLVGDGRHSLGDKEDDLVELAEQLAGPHTLHVLAAGSPRARFLSRLARAGGGHLAFHARALLEDLPRPIVTDIAAESLAGRADGLGPATIASAPLGQPTAIYGRLVTPTAVLAISAQIGTDVFEREIELSAPKRGRDRAVVRGWMRAGPEALTGEIKDVRVMTATQAFLVLETEAEYAQLETGGGASGRGQAVRPRRAAMPTVRIGSATATGDLDKTILRRYVRRARKQIRHCYNRALLRDPSTEGTVRVRWMIDNQGKTHDVSAAGDLDDDELNACMVRVHETLRFPAAKGGGWIAVHYPYSFVPPRRYDDKLSVADEGEVLAHLVRTGAHRKAAVALAEIEAELADQPPRALLPYLSSPKVRRHFAKKFRTAALDRLGVPNPPATLWVAIARSIARDQPQTLESQLGTRDPGVQAASAVLHALSEAGRRRLAAALARAWHNGPMTSEQLYRVFAPDSTLQAALPVRWFFIVSRFVDGADSPGLAVHELVEVSRKLGLGRQAADRILARCQRDSAECRSWLDADLDDPRLFARKTALLIPRIAVLEASRSTGADVDELASLLRALRRTREAERIDSERSDFSSEARW